MKWEGYWWGIVIKSENEEENKTIDALYEKLNKEPDTTYEYGGIERGTIDGLRVIVFNR